MRKQLAAGGEILAGVKILRGIFQVDAQSPLPFVITMMLQNHIPRNALADTNLVKKDQSPVRSMSGEQENYSKPNYIVGTL